MGTGLSIMKDELTMPALQTTHRDKLDTSCVDCVDSGAYTVDSENGERVSLCSNRVITYVISLIEKEKQSTQSTQTL